MKKILSLSACLLLAACGGSGSDSGSDDINNDSPSLSDLSGIYDSSYTEDDVKDEMYLVIRSDGTWTEYDFDGDAFDEGDNCYYEYSGTVEDYGDGEFKIEGEFIIESLDIALVDNGIEITGEDESGNVVVYTYPSSTLSESDFIPLCSEMP